MDFQSSTGADTEAFVVGHSIGIVHDPFRRRNLVFFSVWQDPRQSASFAGSDHRQSAGRGYADRLVVG